MIYCDMDSVLVNFKKSVSEKIGIEIDTKAFDDLGQEKRNKYFSETCDKLEFWTSLEPMPDYDLLWGYVKYWSPSILTAFPMWSKKAKDIAIKGKEIWNKKYTMVPNDRFFCVERKDKQKYALNSNNTVNILIDDKDVNIKEWITSGGIGILHINAIQTISRLKELGYRK